MKTFILFLTFALLACNATDKPNIYKLSTCESELLAKFATVQNEKQYNITTQMLVNAADKSALFCSYMQLSETKTIDTFLTSTGFLLEAGTSYNYNFDSLCNYNAEAVSCLLLSITDVQNLTTNLRIALKIAGSNLCDTIQRNNFIGKNILVSKEQAASDLHLLSKLVEYRPQNSFFINAFEAIVIQADRNSISLYLEKVGYKKFDRFSDEYTTISPEKIAHLPLHIQKLLLSKENS